MPVYSGRPDVPLLHGDLNVAYICDPCEASSIKALKPQVGMGRDWYVSGAHAFKVLWASERCYV